MFQTLSTRTYRVSQYFTKQDQITYYHKCLLPVFWLITGINLSRNFYFCEQGQITRHLKNGATGYSTRKVKFPPAIVVPAHFYIEALVGTIPAAIKKTERWIYSHLSENIQCVRSTYSNVISAFAKSKCFYFIVLKDNGTFLWI